MHAREQIAAAHLTGSYTADSKPMPKALEAKLKKQAKKLGLGKERTGAYVYGNETMQKYMKQQHKTHSRDGR